jgi:hypothetical protein
VTQGNVSFGGKDHQSFLTTASTGFYGFRMRIRDTIAVK